VAEVLLLLLLLQQVKSDRIAARARLQCAWLPSGELALLLLQAQQQNSC